jgi:hypothetical protein
MCGEVAVDEAELGLKQLERECNTAFVSGHVRDTCSHSAGLQSVYERSKRTTNKRNDPYRPQTVAAQQLVLLAQMCGQLFEPEHVRVYVCVLYVSVSVCVCVCMCR